MSRVYKFRNPNASYFVTCGVVNWVDVFTRTLYKDILVNSLKFCQENKGLDIYAWCLMTNHMHMIIKSKPGFLLENTIRDMKKFTSSQIIKAIRNNNRESKKKWMLELFQKAGASNGNNKYFQFWQQHNKPIELFNPWITRQKLNYIHMNPVKEGIVEFPEEYLYSSARNYRGKKGLIDVLFV